MKTISKISAKKSSIIWVFVITLMGSGLSAQKDPLSIDSTGIHIRVAAGQFQQINACQDHAAASEQLIWEDIKLSIQ